MEHRRPERRRAAGAAALVSALALGGCANGPDTRAGASGTAVGGAPGEPVRRDASVPAGIAERAVTRDLADALAQAFEPLVTTLQVNADDDDPLTDAYVRALSDHGFGIQRVPADQGPNYLVHEAVRLDGPGEVAHRLVAGSVEVSRDYRFAGGERVSAISPLRLAGSRARVAVGGDRPVRVAAESPLLNRVEYVGPVPLEAPPPIISLVTPSVVEGAVESAVGAPSRRALNPDRVEVGNLFFGGDAFESLESTHRRVARQVVVFGDDSLVLGADNRAVLERFVDETLEPGDVVGLVGCSNGPTSAEIGNEGLALGRAARVTEALVARGIARERILDQGCWAPTSAGDRFPGRGVVVELWRRNA